MAWNWDNIDWPQTLSALVALATAVQAGVAVVMMRGLKHSQTAAEAAAASVVQSEANAERQQRAYIDFITAHVGEFEAGKPLGLTIEVRNTGQTRALEVVHRSWYVMGDPATLHEYQWPEIVSPSRAVFSPGATMSSHLEVTLDVLERRWGPVTAGINVFIVRGEITYRDIFGKPRLTRYRAQLKRAAHERIFSLSDEGNEAD